MNAEKAKLLLVQHETDRGAHVDRIYEGLTILRKHRHKGFDYRFEHDQMWAGDFDTTIETMTEDEVVGMSRLGWFESEDSWSHW